MSNPPPDMDVPASGRESREELLTRIAELEAECNRLRRPRTSGSPGEASTPPEDWVHLIADAIPQIVWTMDAEGRTEFFNRQWAAYTGVPFEPSTAPEVAAGFIHPEDAAPTLAAWKEAHREGRTLQVEHRIRSASGEYRWFLMRAEPHRDPETGEIVRWFGTSTDIQDQKLAEAALRESEARFRMLADLSPDAILVGMEGRYVYANPAAARVLRAESPDELIGRNPLDLLLPEDRDRVRERFQRIENGGSNPPVEMSWRCLDGSVAEMESAAGAIPWEGKPAIQVIVRDITEHKRAEAEREKFQLLVQNASDAYAIMDPEARIVWANRLMCERLGYTLEELQTLTIPDINPELPLSRYKQFFERARRERVPPTASVHRRKDGTTFPVEITPTVVELAEGPRMFSSVRDITERVRAEQERERLLRETEKARAEAEAARERLGTIFENAPAYIATVRGPDHVFEVANPLYRQLLGNRELVGKPAREAVPELIEQGYIDLLDQVYQTGEPYVATEARVLYQRSAEGPLEEHFINFVYQPLRDAGGAVSGVLGHGVDVTAQVRAREEIERARADAEAANRAKSDFLAAMSHELRTPLNAVGGYVDLLDMGIHGPITDAQRAALSRIAVNQRHLLTLINDILAFAKLEAGQVEFDLRDFPACELLDSIEPLVAPLSEAKGIAYSVQACDPALAARGDGERVRQILLNLVTNAIKFTPAGGWVLLSCDANPESLHFYVRDNGPGIPPEKQQAIFDPFIQVDRRLDRPQEGVGLGLAISRDLARGMGGELSVESTPGEGSTFTLRLPRVQAKAIRAD